MQHMRLTYSKLTRLHRDTAHIVNVQPRGHGQVAAGPLAVGMHSYP